jgi:enamine deaminase RidA (YjgF/YER057c/UK114 family)
MNTNADPKRLKIHPGDELASVFPYSRLVRIGNLIEVSGAGAYDGDEPVAPGNMFLQVEFIYRKIGRVLEEADSGLDDIVKITIFLTDIETWPEVAKAHKLFFEEIRPAVTVIEVGALIVPEMEVEIEVTAYLGD